ncbi:hypothetical protein LX32DRAFT_195913 [Colletotrichum zoysiae]|uniref:Uncharacterized protein n=1 Tax=Colletotrichum zoysiae TaxID=1216348 RepID=A0AAD9HNG1_9PEZI|nr:hypothetical protein LX32DRAFT_195913 [Colletotrichum zoysiae]
MFSLPYHLFKANQWPSHCLGEKEKKSKVRRNFGNRTIRATNSFNSTGNPLQQQSMRGSGHIHLLLAGSNRFLYVGRPASQGDDVSVTTDSTHKDLSVSCKLFTTRLISRVAIADTCGDNKGRQPCTRGLTRMALGPSDSWYGSPTPSFRV